MQFISAIVTAITTVFTTYVPGLASAIVNMFESLFWVAGSGETAGTLTVLGQGLLGLAGIAIVSSIFYIVYRIFKGRMRKTV